MKLVPNNLKSGAMSYSLLTEHFAPIVSIICGLLEGFWLWEFSPDRCRRHAVASCRLCFGQSQMNKSIVYDRWNDFWQGCRGVDV